MKRLISSILVLIIFILSFTVAFADEPLNKVLLKEDGKGRNYQVVNLKIDGKTVKSEDVPPIIYPLDGKGRTLVPLRMITEHLEDKLNAKIEWDGAKREVKIKTREKEITLKIDSPDAIIDGVKKRLPDNVPTKLLAMGNNGRAMVPIRFFAEEFGIDIDWDSVSVTALLKTPKGLGGKPEKQPRPEELGEESDRQPNPGPDSPQGDTDIMEVTDIRVKTDGTVPQIRIKMRGRTDYNKFKLMEPERLVIDLNNTKFNLRDKNRLEVNGTLDIKTDNKAVKRVRVSQFQRPTGEKPDDPFITRIVIELGSLADYEVTFDDKTGEFIIDFVNYIYNIKKETINLKEIIIIEGDMIDDYDIIYLDDPARIAVDIKGAVLHNKFINRTINVDSEIVKSIRTCQHTLEDKMPGEKVARVVIDLYEDIEGEEIPVKVKNNKLEVHMEGEPFRAIQYEETGWTTSKFILKGSEVTRYDIEYQSAPGTIDITVPKADIDLELMNLDVNDHIIKTISISEEGDNYNVQLKLQEAVEYKLLSPERGRELILELNNKDAKYREILIIVDPGHGGSDPGTISPIRGIRESEVALDISLKLNRLLTETGFRTYMTRADDLNKDFKLSLQDRVEIANVLKADLFVSVHVNSFTSNSISGIETFYSSRDTEGKELARIIQSTLVDNLKMIDRGAKPANYYVLEHTIMPAVLVETGFLSNSSDEAKLATNEYREEVAELTFKAIMEYLETTR